MFFFTGIKSIVVVGIFSPACADQEATVAKIISKTCPDMSLTLSHEVGLIGLLERENASILNESLKPLCQRTVAAFTRALYSLDLKCPFYLTQNDGTIIRYMYLLSVISEFLMNLSYTQMSLGNSHKLGVGGPPKIGHTLLTVGICMHVLHSKVVHW